ncbi:MULTISPECIES: pantetheine-phosphate adenylyltransferase [unclassified Pseudofrankia]|uniref:pantetheine-phosphate adenylyltransferase n=1 Tax=unclassified Pseudofrankia TaxID=2994372 RepID=UPI0008DA851A|nr:MULTISPECIES: pantetheine-phosphate adenylyltransferase [unclassified Pseudofrankia]MDT3443772.1 pantetheine-phosphate adenylyltransferase [Pseudofrankia sp. BMG5.37]OHV50012.1 pantetheine-phosphate adenylyltransferase [Pseudofrankia sp. BMG5.36]
MRRAVCPGSFDPITNGHLDIIMRASKLFDEVIVAVSINKTKTTLFTVEERMELIREAVRDHPQATANVVVETSHGLLVDFCQAHGVMSIVKGLRAVSDFDYELQMAQMNNRLAGVETLFMSTNPQYAFLSSSLVKDVARYGGDVSGLVPDVVLKHLRERLQETAE